MSDHGSRRAPDAAAGTAAETAYRVRRSQRARRLRLTIDREGHAVVVLPPWASLRQAAELVHDHADWLVRHTARARVESARLAERPALGEGRILRVAGMPLRVAAVDPGPSRPARGRVDAEPGAGQLIVRLGADGRDAAELLEAWLRGQARLALEAGVARHAPAMAVTPRGISVRDQRTRWGSASVAGRLSFSWRLVLAPPEVLDAVVVHELAHLRVRDHSRRFWELVLRHAPGAREARRWLRLNARELHAALS